MSDATPSGSDKKALDSAAMREAAAPLKPAAQTRRSAQPDEDFPAQEAGDGVRMKLNPAFVTIAFAAAALLGYGFFMWNKSGSFPEIIELGALLMIFITLIGLLAVSTDKRGTTVSIRILSFIFLLLALASNLVFTFVHPEEPSGYIVINGILLLAYFSIAYAIRRAAR